MRILLTGTAGFIGFHLARRLVSEGYDVFSVDNVNAYYDVGLKYKRLQLLGFSRAEIDSCQRVCSKLAVNHQFIKLDLNNRSAMDELFSKYKFDVIVHLAAQAGVRYSLQNPLAYIDDNVGAFANILEGARAQQVQHLVYASSSSVYGLNQTHPYQTSQLACHPVSLYAATKKSSEMMAHAYSHLFQIPTTGLRFFTVYGPWGRPDMAPMLFLQSILASQSIDVFNHGNMYRDFTFIDTVVEGCYRVLKQPPLPDSAWDASQPVPNRSSAPYALYNIGGEQTVKLSDFIKTLETVAGKSAKKKYKNAPPGDVQSTEACMRDFYATFGSLDKVSLKDGLTALVDWYRSYQPLFMEER